MGLAFYLCALLCGSNQKHVPVWQSDTVATIVAAHGDIRIRPNSKPTWQLLGSTLLLREGDRIYSGPGSFVKIKYTKFKETFLSLEELSVIQIADTPPPSSLLLKSFYGGAKSHKVKSASRILIDRPIEAFRLRKPTTHLFFQGGELPKHVKLEYETTPRAPLFATLWELKPKRRPIWSTVIRDQQTDIPIDHDGVYVFLAVSQDRTLQMPPLLLKTDTTSDRLLPQNLMPHDTVVLP